MRADCSTAFEACGVDGLSTSGPLSLRPKCFQTVSLNAFQPEAATSALATTKIPQVVILVLAALSKVGRGATRTWRPLADQYNNVVEKYN